MKTVLASLVLTTAAFPAGAQTPYRAGGTEPFWTLTIERGTMRLDQVGAPAISERAPVARPSINGRRYVGRRLIVDVTRAPCRDGMSARRYPETVTVSTGRRTLRGCGGNPAMPGGDVALANSRWRIIAIDGRPVRLDRPAEIAFSADRVSGRPGCNSIGGGYRLAGNRLAFSALVATRMACPGEPMRVENAFMRIAGTPVEVRPGADGVMLWQNHAGSVTLRKVR